MLGVAIISVAIGSAVTWAKFGVLFGRPLNDYTAFHVLNEKRINGGREFDLAYLPSTLFAYLQPGGLRLTSLFPYITLPAGPTRTVGGILLDNRTRTASVTASMPLMVLLGCLGVLSSFRRHASEQVKKLRIVLVASAATTAAVLFFGWIANRYLADFLPFLIIASAIGAVVLWRRLENQSKRTHVVASGIVGAIGVVGIIANVALSITPTDAYSPAQAAQFLRIQNAASNVTGHPLAGQILRGDQLPYWAPADTVFIGGNCNALYVSNGENYAGVLDQRVERKTWVVVEEGPGYTHTLSVTFGAPSGSSGRGVPLLTFGHSTLLMHSAAAPAGFISVWFTLEDPKFGSTSIHALVRPGTTHSINLVTDRYADTLSVVMDDGTYVDGPVTTDGFPVVRIEPGGVHDSFVIRNVAAPPSTTALCRTLSAEH